MFEAATPTIFELMLFYAQQTTVISRGDWLADPKSAAEDFLNQTTAGQMMRYADPGTQRAIGTQAICVGSWAASGFPTFDVTHRLAATLMATKVLPEQEEHIVSPFPGCMVKLPDNLLFVQDEDGNLSSCSILCFAFHLIKGAPGISYIMMSQSKTAVFGTMPRVGFTTSDTWDKLDQGEVTAEEIDERASELARKLILGLCLYLSDPAKLGSPKQQRAKPRASQRAPGQLPVANVYVIGRELGLNEDNEAKQGAKNIITAIREYAKHGAGKAPAVQYIVRGHWKMQAHGPGRTERKLIQVAPYWRGPVDAPILTHGGGDVSQIPAWLRKPKKD